MKRLVVVFGLMVTWLVMLTSVCFAQGGPTVFVSIVPQKYFVERIAGELVDVEVMVLPGASPATYEPKPSQMRKLATASIYFAVGVPFEESWLGRISGVNREIQIIHTEKGIEKIAMLGHGHHAEDHEGHENEADHDHDAQGLDPHIWLSTSLVKRQVTVIAESLIKLLPGKRVILEENLKAFSQDIDRVDAEVRMSLAGKEGMEFMVFHPSWGYFAREYGLRQIAVEIEGKNPKPAQLTELIKLAQEHEIKVVFAQPQFSQKSVRVIARSIGGQVILIDPLAEDWLDNLRRVGRQLKKVFDEQ